jgi:hypothetical protein
VRRSLFAFALSLACVRTVSPAPDVGPDASPDAAPPDAVIDVFIEDRLDANGLLRPVFTTWAEGRNDACTAEGWCWENPSPAGGDIASISSSAPDDGWALTTEGVLLHATRFAVRATRVHAYDATRTAGVVWSAAPDSVWVATRGALLHWNGAAMRRVTFYDGFNEPTGVWGRGADDVWLSGPQGDVLHFDGARWTRRALPTSADVVTLTGSAQEVWAIDAQGVVWRWRDTAWARGETVSLDGWRSPWIVAADEAWACGDGVVRRWDGAAWIREAVDGASASPRCAVWSDGASVWFSDGLSVRRRTADGLWSYEGDTRVVTAAGGATTNVWVGRGDGVIQRVEEGRWVAVTGTRPRFDVTRVVGDDAATLRAITVATVMGFDGVAWFEASAPGAFYELQGVWPQGAGGSWLAGLVRRGGRESGRASLWNRVDGERAVLDAPTPLRAVAASADDDVWAVGDAGAAWHFDGIAWSRVETGITTNLADVWVAGRDAAWAVGADAALRWDGAAWTRMVLPASIALTRVHGRSRDDVWAVGQAPSRAYALHWDGATLRSDSAGLPAGYTARGVWAGARGVWIAGTTILRRDERVWNVEAIGTEATLRAVWGARDGSVRAAGSTASIFVRRPP